MTTKAKLGIFCPYPPPYTGVTVHAARLHEVLNDEGIPHTVYAPHGLAEPEPGIVPGQKKASWYLKTFMTCPEPVVHVHTYRPMPAALAGLILACRRKKCLCHIHSEGMVKLYHQAGFLCRWLYRVAFRRYDVIIAVNEDLRRFAIDVLGVREERVRVLPAFIPPTASGLAAARLPGDVAGFIQTHAPNFCATGSFGVYHEGQNTYGFELILDMLKEIHTDYPDAGLVLAVNYVDDESHREAFKETVRQYGLDDNVLILEDLGTGYLDLVRKSDVFLRPTYTEGDALSVREALYLGVPSVASDCAVRPRGCEVFRTGDVSDCVARVREVVSHSDQARAKARTYEDPRADRALVDIYREMIAAKDSQRGIRSR
jgi:glycosyltransferase involved in cell wall biosynthesis